MIKYPVGTIVRILPDPDDDMAHLVALGQQRGTPVVRAGSTFVVAFDSPARTKGIDADLVVLGLQSGWAGARENQIEIVRERRRPAADPKWTLTPPNIPGEWEPYAYLVGAADGWDLYWIPKGCEDPGEQATYHTIEWPFGPDDVVEREDFERLGFRVEE